MANNHCVLSHFSQVQLFMTLWTIAHQTPRSMGSSRQEYWSGLPRPPLGDLPDPGIEPTPLISPALAGEFFTTSATWEAPFTVTQLWNSRARIQTQVCLQSTSSLSLSLFLSLSFSLSLSLSLFLSALTTTLQELMHYHPNTLLATSEVLTKHYLA